jgi:hypothetical protein
MSATMVALKNEEQEPVMMYEEESGVDVVRRRIQRVNTHGSMNHDFPDLPVQVQVTPGVSSGEAVVGGWRDCD